MDERILSTLASCPLFEGMTTAHIEELMNGVAYRLTRFDKGDVCNFVGESLMHLGIVVSGEITARMMGASGRMVEIIRWQQGGMITPGFIFAANNNLPVTIEAKSRAVLLRLSSQTLQHLIDTCEPVRANFIRRLSDIVAFLTDKLHFLTLLTVREKVACFLLEMARIQHSLTITLNDSRQTLADRFGIQKFSLLRCLASLTAEGAIKVEGRHITILQRKRLAQGLF